MARALVVEESGQLRSKLKQLAEHCGHFTDVDAVSNFDQARVQLALGKVYSYIFVSIEFNSSLIASFVEDARLFPGTAMSTIIAFGSGDNGTVDAVANQMLVGVHGFMFDHYTVDRLNEIIELAGKAQAQGTHMRLRAATGLILTDILENVSKVSELQNLDGVEPKSKGDLWDRIQHSLRMYKQLTGESIGTSVAVDLKRIAPSRRVPEYRGVSKRVRSVLENHFANQIKRLVKRSVKQHKSSQVEP